MLLSKPIYYLACGVTAVALLLMMSSVIFYIKNRNVVTFKAGIMLIFIALFLYLGAACVKLLEVIFI